MIDLNTAVDHMKKILTSRYPELTVEIRKSNGSIPAQGDEYPIDSLLSVLMDLAARFGARSIRLENGFCPVGEGFNCLVSHSSASYAYLSADVRLSSRLAGETTPFAQQGCSLMQGLSAAVAALEGYVQVEARDRDVLRYKIRLPIAVQPAWNEPKIGVGEGRTILLVEDEEFVRSVTQEVLEMEGFQVLVAGNGIDAVRIAEKSASHIDLLLTDVVLPGMNGREVADVLVEQIAGLRVIFMSGYADDPVVSMKGSRQAYYLTKPFTLDTLIERIRLILEEGYGSETLVQRANAGAGWMEARG